jgi:hypothetical protein
MRSASSAFFLAFSIAIFLRASIVPLSSPDAVLDNEGAAAAKAEEQARLQRENAEFSKRKQSIGAATVNQLSDDENRLRAEAASAAAKAKADKEEQLQRENAEFSKRKQSIGAATDHQLR